MWHRIRGFRFFCCPCYFGGFGGFGIHFFVPGLLVGVFLP